MAATQGDGSVAKRRLEEALELAREHGNPLLEAEILEERSELRAGAGQLALARADLQVAAALYRRLGAVKRQAGAEERLSALGR